jgi:hypothetical protein
LNPIIEMRNNGNEVGKRKKKRRELIAAYVK